MGLSVPSGTKWDSESGLDGTLRECGGLSGTEDLCLLIRDQMFHPVPPDTIWCYPVNDPASVCIWRCPPLLGGVNQYGGKMVAKKNGVRPESGAFCPL